MPCIYVHMCFLLLSFCNFVRILYMIMSHLRSGKFTFTFQISAIYPHEAPKVKCRTKVNQNLVLNVAFNLSTKFGGIANKTVCLKVYHPNIDLEGNVCLNILREDWKPVLNINTIIYGLYHLFTVSFSHQI